MSKNEISETKEELLLFLTTLINDIKSCDVINAEAHLTCGIREAMSTDGELCHYYNGIKDINIYIRLYDKKLDHGGTDV